MKNAPCISLFQELKVDFTNGEYFEIIAIMRVFDKFCKLVEKHENFQQKRPKVFGKTVNTENTELGAYKLKKGKTRRGN